MIKSLRVKNFKSHKDTTLVFDKGVNVIQGLSTTGKSAILNALRLLFNNRPQGGHYFSNFAGDKGATEIELELMDGQKVSLTKGIRVDKDGEKKVIGGVYTIGENEFTCPKEGIPDQVAEALNIGELNIQRQHSAPFLIMSSPGENARMVNRITKLEKTDEWVSDLASKINEGNRTILSTQEEIKQAEINLKKYSDIDETKKIVDALVAVDREIPHLEEDRDFLSNQLGRHKSYSEGVEELKACLAVESVLSLADKLSQEIEDYYALVDLFNRYVDDEEKKEVLFEDIAIIESLLLKIDQCDYSKEQRKRDSLVSYQQTYFSAQGRLRVLATALEEQVRVKAIEDLREEIIDYEDLMSFVEGYRQNLEQLAGIGVRLSGAKEEYVSELKRIGKCPTCYSSIDAALAKRIKGQL
ncbi:MAG: AAA family ATPase [Candidatus Paceibacterota bacterium]